MKITGWSIKPEEFNGNKFFALYILIEDKEFRIGTLRETKSGLCYINCMHKEFKK